MAVAGRAQARDQFLFLAGAQLGFGDFLGRVSEHLAPHGRVLFERAQAVDFLGQARLLAVRGQKIGRHIGRARIGIEHAGLRLAGEQ
ncbi:MAG: hypothetical protein ACKOJB_15090, partial [Chthoniobacterales bacterium]